MGKVESVTREDLKSEAEPCALLVNPLLRFVNLPCGFVNQMLRRLSLASGPVLTEKLRNQGDCFLRFFFLRDVATLLDDL